MNILPREFYMQGTVLAARSLLGKRLVRRTGGGEISGIITETEAYGHADDPASHAFRGATERKQGDVRRGLATAYVYFTYGMHFCFNVVARDGAAKAGAVLIRAIRPESGMEIMLQNRRVRDVRILSDGPAKLTQALCITREHSGIDLTAGPLLFIAEGIRADRIAASPRVGIRKATDRLWNFKMG